MLKITCLLALSLSYHLPDDAKFDYVVRVSVYRRYFQRDICYIEDLDGYISKNNGFTTDINYAKKYINLKQGERAAEMFFSQIIDQMGYTGSVFCRPHKKEAIFQDDYLQYEIRSSVSQGAINIL